MGVSMKRLVELGVKSGLKTNINGGFAASVSKQRPYDYRRHLSQLVNPNVIVDRLAVANDLKANGIPPEKAEAISSAMAEVFNNTFKAVSADLVSKAEMEMNSKMQEAYLPAYKCLLQDSQERYFIKMQKENSLIHDLLADIDHEIHGLKAKLEGQKADINAQIRELKHHLDAQNNYMKAKHEAVQQQLASLNEESKLECETLKANIESEKHNMKVQVENARRSAIKYYIGGLVSVVSVFVVITADHWLV